MANLELRRYTAGEVGIRLRNNWEKSGLTQVKFAKKLGISQPLLSQIISGERAPNEAVLKLLGMKAVERYYVEIG